MSSSDSVLACSLVQKGKMLIDFRFKKFLISEVFLSTAFCSHLTSTKSCIWMVLLNVLICKQLFPSSSGIMKPGLNAILGPTGSGKSS